MATPEAKTPQLESLIAELRLIPGGLATGQTVEIIPNAPGMDMDDFKTHVHGLGTEGDTAQQLGTLLELRATLNEPVGEINTKITELMMQLDDLHKKKMWVQGYIADRQRALEE